MKLWKLSKFLLFSIFIKSCFSAKEDSMANSFNCYADYLKRHGLLESDFHSEPFNGESFLCEIVLSTTVEGVYNTLQEEFSKTEEFRDSAECIVEFLRDAKWSDLDIKEQVIETSEKLSPEEKEIKIGLLKNLQGKISSDAIVSCMAEKEFGELFDEIFKKDEQEDYVGDYCARVFAVEKNLLDTKIYHINPNPNSIITKNINCEVINERHFVEAENELRQHLLRDFGENPTKVDCLIRKYHENHYFNRTLAIALLGELNITEQQKKSEKTRFIQSMIKITEDLSEC